MVEFDENDKTVVENGEVKFDKTKEQADFDKSEQNQ